MKKCSIKLNIVLVQKIISQMIMVINTWTLKINIDDNLPEQKKKKILIGSVFNNENEYYPQVFSEECCYECKKCFDILIMNATSKNKFKNEKMKQY